MKAATALVLGGAGGFLAALGVFHLTQSYVIEFVVGAPLGFVNGFLISRGLSR